ncbi:hypothetical protein EIP86_007478 [Pleurotus ostreatoroseus]|nr:hypothetical protein EIP86_007478 [Pleurotus ostreatoroseus]
MQANVFTLAFSATNQYLYSGDTNETILKYDLTRLGDSSSGPGVPESAFSAHSENVRAITCHPELDAVFISTGYVPDYVFFTVIVLMHTLPPFPHIASDDGKILLHDARAGHTRQAALQHGAEVTSAQFHPAVPHVFATADARGGVCLRDTRMAFGPEAGRRTGGVVQTYVTALSKTSVSHLARPEATSVTFDRTGSKLAVTFLSYYPTIYSLADPLPLAVCSARTRPDGSPIPAGERTYTNVCTMKVSVRTDTAYPPSSGYRRPFNVHYRLMISYVQHGSFGGPGLDSDEYYSAGSDDFCAYVWKVPGVEELRLARETVSANRWKSLGEERIAFTAFPTKDRHIPVDLSTPLARLAGHKSIVNTALFHPHLPLLLTAGVERHIFIHSPTPNGPCLDEMEPTPTEVRQLPGPSLHSHRIMIRALTSGLAMDDDDASTIALFDEIFRSEGESDVFDTRRWNPDSDEEPEEHDSSDDDDHDDSDERSLDMELDAFL